METLFKHNVKWKISLSNGETFYEGKGKFKDISGLKSPFQRLLDYTLDTKTYITSLSLYTDDGKSFNLPSAGKRPQFKEFSNLEKPLDYNICRKITRKISRIGFETDEWFTVAEAIYPKYKLQLWVDEKNPKNCWVLTVFNDNE
jgi:hypothetical protein